MDELLENEEHLYWLRMEIFPFPANSLDYKEVLFPV
jgi:hypothetical protein